MVEVGDLVYIHESYGPLPKDLFAVVTRVAHPLPALGDRYPLTSVELWVFKEKPKICSWYEPKHLTILEKKYDTAGKGVSNYAHSLMVKCFNEEYDKHLEKNNG